jgi:hypothetical protein
MRKLLVLSVVAAALMVCAPSYGYILVYKVTGGMKAVEWNVEKIISVSVKGYLALDINNVSEEVDDAEMVLYGKDVSGDLVYFDDTLGGGGNRINWDATGDVVGVDVWNYSDPFEHEFMMTGKVKATDVGLGTSTKKLAASSLKGSLVIWWAQILDDSQDLFGSGTATMTLDTKQTKAANAANVITPGSVTVGTIIDTFITGLQAKGYSSIIL